MTQPRQTKPEQYIQDVLTGTQLTNKWVRAAIKRHISDLDSGASRGLVFDPERGQHVIGFIERFIPGTEGEFKGQPFILEPWMAALLYILYGWRWAETGHRRFKFAYVEVSRGNLKSTLASALCLYELLSEPGANVYAASTDRKTSKVVFDTSAMMVELSPALKPRIKAYRNCLSIPKAGSRFEPCSAEAKSIFANSRPSFVVIDELHLHPTPDVWNAFASALGKRNNSMLFAITNSGYDKLSVCGRQREYSLKVLDRIIEDDSWFAWPCGLDDEDIERWECEELWGKANPSLGHAVSLLDMRAAAAKAKADPAELNSFLRLRLSVWTESHTQWMPAETWAECSEAVDPDALAGRPCFAGLDLSSTTDITAFVLLLPPYGDDPKWRVIPHFYLPEDAVTKRSKRDRVPYDGWAKKGLFTLTPGNVVDTAFIREDIRRAAEKYRIIEVAYDKALSADLTPQLQNDGLTMVPFHPGEISQTPPLKKLMELAKRKELAHGGNPVLAWMAHNLVVRIGATGLMKPDKAMSRERIDGMSALLDALGRAMIVPITTTSGVPYRGLRSV